VDSQYSLLISNLCQNVKHRYEGHTCNSWSALAGRVKRVDRGGRVQLGSTQKFSEGGVNYMINFYIFIKFFN